MSCCCVNSFYYSLENCTRAEALVQFFPRKIERINTPTRHVLLQSSANNEWVLKLGKLISIASAGDAIRKHKEHHSVRKIATRLMGLMTYLIWNLLLLIWLCRLLRMLILKRIQGVALSQDNWFKKHIENCLCIYAIQWISVLQWKPFQHHLSLRMLAPFLKVMITWTRVISTLSIVSKLYEGILYGQMLITKSALG